MDLIFQDTLIHKNHFFNTLQVVGKDGADGERIGTTFDDTKTVFKICLHRQQFSKER
jgi:hypothetical protein